MGTAWQKCSEQMKFPFIKCLCSVRLRAQMSQGGIPLRRILSLILIGHRLCPQLWPLLASSAKMSAGGVGSEEVRIWQGSHVMYLASLTLRLP